MNVALSPIFTVTLAIHPSENSGAESAQVLYLNMSGKSDNAVVDGWCIIKHVIRIHDDNIGLSCFF